jgi:hypothetical protein
MQYRLTLMQPYLEATRGRSPRFDESEVPFCGTPRHLNITHLLGSHTPPETSKFYGIFPTNNLTERKVNESYLASFRPASRWVTVSRKNQTASSLRNHAVVVKKSASLV